jgi:hypothetical protein
MAQRLLTGRGRVAARIVTGPLAHFYGGFVDWLILLSRYLWARARGRRLS